MLWIHVFVSSILICSVVRRFDAPGAPLACGAHRQGAMDRFVAPGAADPLAITTMAIVSQIAANAGSWPLTGAIGHGLCFI
ncbi:MAG: hypothetical protein AMXMBFR6_06260 [Betaproteobacteria bacterium]|nr:hypothetical protein [Rhodocyclaceae bacterium]